MPRPHMLLAILCAVLLAGCASGGPHFEQMQADQLLQYGLDKLKDHDWDDASRALEQFIFQFPTHARYQEARFRLGEAYYGKEEYITAANEFSRLANEYPAGPWADDARFRVCQSYYELSPKAELDQEYTLQAIDQCRSLVTFYPESEYTARAKEMIASLTDKLARKMFLNGEYYYRIHAYDSAIKYLNDMLKAYPDAAITPHALLLLYDSYQQLGYQEEATSTRERLLRDFPTSEEARKLAGASVASAS